MGNTPKALAPWIRELMNEENVDELGVQLQHAHDAIEASERRLAEAGLELMEWHAEMAAAANDSRLHFLQERNGMRMALAAIHQRRTLMAMIEAAARRAEHPVEGAAPIEGGE